MSMSDNFLMNPSFLELDDAYRGMPRHSLIEIKTGDLQKALKDMEKIGFVAIEIVNMAEGQTTWTIRASKGKHGPCTFTGNYTAYKGVARAALDDDLHLMPANQFIEVCDKTHAVHALSAYKGLIEDSSSSDFAQYKTEKENENEPDDFDSTLSRLYESLKETRADRENRKMLFYPGPFRLLILQDGTIARRGKWNAIPSTMADQLIHEEGLIISKSVQQEEPVFFQEQYEEMGASALMDELKLEKQEKSEYSTFLNSLEHISKALKDRLLRLINEKKKYFVLVGSDQSDKLGCCPSEEVTEANRLVKSGILTAYSEPDQGEACPLTFYGIKGEMTLADTGLEVNFNDRFRKQIQNRLIRKKSKATLFLKWFLIAFVFASALLAVRRCYQQQSVPTMDVSYENLLPVEPGQLQLVLFHNEKRCHQCLTMEALVNELMADEFSDDMQEGTLAFKTVAMDDPVNQPLVNQLGIFAATLVFMEFDSETLTYARVLTRGGELYRDEAAFRSYLGDELTAMLKE
jgi:hypothetical protein